MSLAVTGFCLLVIILCILAEVLLYSLYRYSNILTEGIEQIEVR
jgi:hypothetical protein